MTHDFELGNRITHVDYSKGTVNDISNVNGTDIIQINFDGFLAHITFYGNEIKQLRIYINNTLYRGCECGTIYTSAPNIHMLYCPNFKNVN